ncbi:MAG TPA: TPM domain-containing protein, partial [Mycobacterium sp.]|nr:TPM domain-containing protein [Mycobacterium sp.]
PPPLIGERRPDLAALDPVIAKALAKSPNERYGACADFAAALAGGMDTAPRDIASPTEVIAAPTEVIAAPQNPAPPAQPKPRRRFGTAALVATLVAIALVAAAAVIGVHMLGGKAGRAQSGTPSQSASATAGGAPPSSKPGLKLTGQITDRSGVLGPVEHDAVNRALNKLRNAQGTKLWVVYVKSFEGLKPFRWAEETMRANGFTDKDAMLAVATDQPSYSFRVPIAVTAGKPIDVDVIRRDRIEPAVVRREWTRAAIAAANGLDVPPS